MQPFEYSISSSKPFNHHHHYLYKVLTCAPWDHHRSNCPTLAHMSGRRTGNILRRLNRTICKQQAVAKWPGHYYGRLPWSLRSLRNCHLHCKEDSQRTYRKNDKISSFSQLKSLKNIFYRSWLLLVKVYFAKQLFQLIVSECHYRRGTVFLS